MNVEFNRNEDHLKQLSFQLRQKLARVALGGGEKRIAAHKAKGKLTARELSIYSIRARRKSKSAPLPARACTKKKAAAPVAAW
jgi:hypothetical protein